MRILHVGLFLHLGSGQRAQLAYERDAAEKLDTAEWVTHTLTPADERTDAGPQVPRWARRFQLHKLFIWWHIWRNASRYDVVMMRSLSPDPFAALAAPLIPNLYTVHHSKEIEELDLVTRGARRRITLFLEGPLKTWAFRRLRGVIGVTPEISDYEHDRFPRAPIVATYANGIDLATVSLAKEPAGDDETVHAVFVATVFYAWQGLDRLLESLTALSEDEEPPRLVVHLVGELEPQHLRSAQLLAARGLVELHGVLDRAALDDVFARSHIAIASLALDRKALRQASTLKVREYLAAGLPVYSTHVDAGLPPEFPFYFCDDEGFSAARMIAFLTGRADHTRAAVREAARPHIDKLSIMNTLVDQLAPTTATGGGDDSSAVRSAS